MLDAVPSFSSTRSAAIPFVSLRDDCEIIASDGSMPAAKPRGASRAISARAAPGPNPISRTWSSGCTSRASTASAFMAALPHSMILPAIHPNLPRGQSIHPNLPRGHRNWDGGRADIGSLLWMVSLAWLGEEGNGPAGPPSCLTLCLLAPFPAQKLAPRDRYQYALQVRVRFGSLPERGEFLRVREHVV